MMGRRSRTSGKPVRTRRRKTTLLRRAKRPKAERRGRSRAPGRETKLAQLTRELNEALQQQTATAEVLKVISNSPNDLEPVFATMLEKAVRICDAKFGNIYRWDGGALHLVATHNTPAAFAELRRRTLTPPDPRLPFGRMAATKKVIHVADVTEEAVYLEQRDPMAVAVVELTGMRTLLAVPMLRDSELVGAFSMYRQEVRPFTDKQVALVTSFAAQAVIAIENARLFNELRQRTDDLGRSLDMLERERNNKLMNLEAMVASVSHEVRQPLASIALNGSAARRFLGHSPPNLAEVQLAIDRMVSDSDRASQVFDNIRDLFGKASRGPEPINVSELARGVLQSLREELNEHGITTRAKLTSKLPPIIGHRGQLQEVLFNLVHNAIEAMDSIKDDRRILQVRAEHDGDNSIVVAVEDSGPGIDPKLANAIFDPFVTTKPRGMGLGLAICRMIVERHEGQLSASPAHPRGSVFRVALPAGTPSVQ